MRKVLHTIVCLLMLLTSKVNCSEQPALKVKRSSQACYYKTPTLVTNNREMLQCIINSWASQAQICLPCAITSIIIAHTGAYANWSYHVLFKDRIAFKRYIERDTKNRLSICNESGNISVITEKDDDIIIKDCKINTLAVVGRTSQIEIEDSILEAVFLGCVPEMKRTRLNPNKTLIKKKTTKLLNSPHSLKAPCMLKLHNTSLGTLYTDFKTDDVFVDKITVKIKNTRIKRWGIGEKVKCLIFADHSLDNCKIENPYAELYSPNPLPFPTEGCYSLLTEQYCEACCVFDNCDCCCCCCLIMCLLSPICCPTFVLWSLARPNHQAFCAQSCKTCWGCNLNRQASIKLN